MHRFSGLARRGLGYPFAIWESGRFRAALVGATAAARTARKRPGFERAAEDPLGARE